MFTQRILLSTITAMAGLSFAATASAGGDAYLGEIISNGYNFCPRGTTSADGQLLAVSQYNALFSLYGTTFGGDGRTTFGLPDLRGRVPVGQGTGSGLSNRRLGSKGGSQTNTQTAAQVAPHTHLAGIKTVNKIANSNDPRGNTFTVTPTNIYHEGQEAAARYMHENTVDVQPSVGGQPQNNMQPYLAIRYCVYLDGVYPSRN